MFYTLKPEKLTTTSPQRSECSPWPFIVEWIFILSWSIFLVHSGPYSLVIRRSTILTQDRRTCRTSWTSKTWARPSTANRIHKTWFGTDEWSMESWAESSDYDYCECSISVQPSVFLCGHVLLLFVLSGHVSQNTSLSWHVSLFQLREQIEDSAYLGPQSYEQICHVPKAASEECPVQDDELIGFRPS